MNATTYDAIPYTSYPYERTHPDRLATVAALFGMQPARPCTARVLELGCASGGNLLPMAEQLPRAEFTGIDLSATQIGVGKAAMAAAGLTNVALVAGDLAQIDDAWGTFDYILCHGVLSWVDAPVRTQILRIFAQRLRPQGVGFISYNTYPGWHLRQAVREMMLFHVAQFEQPAQQAAQAQALLDFVVAHGPSAQQGGNPGFAALVQREAELLRQMPPDYLFHEHLEEHNTPLYFHALEAQLRDEGLAYLGDADVSTMMTDPLSADAAAQLQQISPDLVRLEQYLDFVRGRQFRSTLVCRGDATLSRQLTGQRVVDRYVGLRTAPPHADHAVDLRPGVEQAFVGAGITMRSDIPITKAALHQLRACAPAVIAFGVLLAQARQMLREADIDAGPADEHALSADVLRCFLGGGLELRTEAPRFVPHAGANPRVSAYARWQAVHCDFVTNTRHVRMEMDKASRAVVAMLDGTRDRAALCEGLAQRVADGTLTLSRDDAPLTDPAQWAAPLSAVLDHTLRALADGALLLA